MSKDAGPRALLETEGVPFIRTDFSSDGWESVVKIATAETPEGFRADVTVISDHQYSGWSVDQVRPFVDASRHGLVVLVDDFALNNPGYPLLVASAEFDDELRCEAASLARIENNLSLGNTEWIDCYRSTDADGVYRGSSRSNNDEAGTTYREFYLGTRERLESLIRTIADQRRWRFVERSDADLAITDVSGNLLKLRFEPNDD